MKFADKLEQMVDGWVQGQQQQKEKVEESPSLVKPIHYKSPAIIKKESQEQSMIKNKKSLNYASDQRSKAEPIG